MALIDVRGFNLQPQAPSLTGGLQELAGFQALGQRNIQQGRSEQIRQLLGQAVAAPTEQQQQLAAQSVGLGEDPAIKQAGRTQEELKQLAREIDPIVAEDFFKKAGIDSASKRADASRFAAKIQSLPEEQQNAAINARAQEIQARGGNATETLQLLDLDPAQRDQALLGVQLFDLSTKERLGVKALQAKVSAKRIEAKDVKSSKILDDGTVITVLKNGDTVVTNPAGEELAGEARIQAVRDSQEFGVDIQQRRSKGRELGKGAGKIALTGFETVGKIKENVLDLKRGIDLIEKEGARTGFISDFLPSMRASTRKFDNLRRKLGLNVVASVTFGALSEGELNLAMDVALPKGMSQEETVKWIKDRISAQEKLADNLEDASLFLADHSVAELIQRNRDMAKAAKKKEGVIAAKPAAQPPAAPGGVKFLGFE